MKKFLCPVGLDSLMLRGAFGQNNFDFVRIEVKGCDMGPELCLPDDEIYMRNWNYA